MIRRFRSFAIACGVFLLAGAGSAAAQTCYESQPGPQVMSCTGNQHHNSADFSGTCAMVPGPPVQVQVPCPGRWVNASSSSMTHAQTCQAAGLKVANLNGEICASGERRPHLPAGSVPINYRYGTWGGAGVAGTFTTTQTFQQPPPYCGDSPCGNHVPTTVTNIYCWMNGQIQDHDATDLVVAYYCQ